jgi:hypothetical protein
MTTQHTPYAHWTPERDKRLLEMIGRGLTAGQIAPKLGVSRSSVIGRSHRLKAKMVAERPGPKPKPRPKTPARPAPRAAALRKRVVAGIALPPAKPCIGRPSPSAEIIPATRAECFQPLPDTAPISLIETGSRLCRFPVNGLLGRDDHFCGQPKTDESSPYCVIHSRIAFNPAPLKRL